jgi:hypothetical protein
MQAILFPRQLMFGMGGGGGGGFGGASLDSAKITDVAGGLSSIGGGGGGGGAPTSGAGYSGGSGTGNVYKSGETGMVGAAEDMGAGTVQMITGLVQGIQGIKQKKEAQKLFPSLIDPLEARAYSEYKSLERSTQTGLAQANDLSKIAAGQQAVNRGISAKAGGNVGLAVAGMSKTAKSFGEAMNSVISKTMEQRQFYTAMADKKQERITDTKRGLQLLKYNQKMAEGTQNEQEGKSNTMGGATRAMAGVNSGIASMQGGM